MAVRVALALLNTPPAGCSHQKALSLPGGRCPRPARSTSAMTQPPPAAAWPRAEEMSWFWLFPSTLLAHQCSTRSLQLTSLWLPFCNPTLGSPCTYMAQPPPCAWAMGAVRWAPYLEPGHRAGLRAMSGRLSTVPSTLLQDPSGWYPRVALALGMGSDVLAARKLGGLAAIIVVPISVHLRNEKAHFSYTMLAYINNNELSSLGHLFQMLHPQGAKTCCIARSWLLPSQSVPKTFFWVINSKPYGSAEACVWCGHPLPLPSRCAAAPVLHGPRMTGSREDCREKKGTPAKHRAAASVSPCSGQSCCEPQVQCCFRRYMQPVYTWQ